MRHKIRAPSFNNVPTFKVSGIGQRIADVAITLAGVDPDRRPRLLEPDAGRPGDPAIPRSAQEL